jgi:hypothetical protein
MKRHPLYLFAALMAVMLVAGNCRKSELSLENNANTEITISIAGRVLDKDNMPVGQAQVSAGSVTGTTDVNGYFRLNSVRTNKDAAYVKVEKLGYFPGSRTFVATSSSAVNFVRIRLITKEHTGAFQSAAGGKVDLPAGGSITFQANGVVDANNNSYSGTVNVSAFFIDPTDADFRSIMPGDLRGLNTSDRENGLQSFGMMAVEIRNTTGQKLQLASGKKATVRFPIPASISAQAPATILLWYFDEAKGLWKEEGSATKQGNEYVGEVSHFSFWNCDAPFPLVNFQAVVKDQNGAPVANALVIIKRIDNGSSGAGITDSSGSVCGKIPANQPLELKIQDRCNTVIHTQNIGPFSGNTNLGTITVTVNPPATVTISGTAVTCASTPVTNGYVNVYLEGMNYRTAVNNGNFSVTISRCSNTPVQAKVLAVDVAAGVLGTNTILNVSSGAVNAGQLVACGVTSTQFINYTLGSSNYAFAAPPDSILFYLSTHASANVLMGDDRGTNNLMLQYTGNSTGTFPLQFLSLKRGNKYYYGQTGNINITQYGNAGDFVQGTFTTTVSDSTNNFPMTGTFKALRTQ